MLDYDVFQNEKGLLITIYCQNGVFFITYFDTRTYMIKPDCMRVCERWGIYYTGAKHSCDPHISQSEFDWYCHQQEKASNILHCCNGEIWTILKSYKQMTKISYCFVPFTNLLHQSDTPDSIEHNGVRIILRGTGFHYKQSTSQIPMSDSESLASHILSPLRMKKPNHPCKKISYDSPKRTIRKRSYRISDNECNTVEKERKRKYIIQSCDSEKKILPRLRIPDYYSASFKARKLLF